MTSARERAIVVVEDSEEDFTAFRRALGKSAVKADVVRFADGQACLDALRRDELPEAPAFVVLDLNLPALSGVEILKEMRDDPALRGIPVVVLTTSANPADVQRCYDLGVGGYFLKEGDFAGFCEKIESMAKYWLRAVHLP